MTTRILQRRPLHGKGTLDEAKESEGSSKELEFTSDGEVDDTHSTPGRAQVSSFCTIVLFIYVFYIFFLAVFIVASVMFIKTGDTRPGPTATNSTIT